MPAVSWEYGNVVPAGRQAGSRLERVAEPELETGSAPNQSGGASSFVGFFVAVFPFLFFIFEGPVRGNFLLDSTYVRCCICLPGFFSRFPSDASAQENPLPSFQGGPRQVLPAGVWDNKVGRFGDVPRVTSGYVYTRDCHRIFFQSTFVSCCIQGYCPKPRGHT